MYGLKNPSTIAFERKLCGEISSKRITTDRELIENLCEKNRSKFSHKKIITLKIIINNNYKSTSKGNLSERFGKNCFQVLFFPGANLGLLKNELQVSGKFLQDGRKKKRNTKKQLTATRIR